MRRPRSLILLTASQRVVGLFFGMIFQLLCLSFYFIIDVIAPLGVFLPFFKSLQSQSSDFSLLSLSSAVNFWYFSSSLLPFCVVSQRTTQELSMSRSDGYMLKLRPYQLNICWVSTTTEREWRVKFSNSNRFCLSQMKEKKTWKNLKSPENIYIFFFWWVKRL